MLITRKHDVSRDYYITHFSYRERKHVPLQRHASLSYHLQSIRPPINQNPVNSDKKIIWPKNNIGKSSIFVCKVRGVIFLGRRQQKVCRSGDRRCESLHRGWPVSAHLCACSVTFVPAPPLVEFSPSADCRPVASKAVPPQPPSFTQQLSLISPRYFCSLPFSFCILTASTLNPKIIYVNFEWTSIHQGLLICTEKQSKSCLGVELVTFCHLFDSAKFNYSA